MWNPQRLHCSTTASRNTGNEKKFKIKSRFCKLLIPDYTTPRLLSEVRIPLIIPRQGRADVNRPERSLQSRPTARPVFLSQNRRIIQNQTPLCDSPKPDTCHLLCCTKPDTTPPGYLARFLTRASRTGVPVFCNCNYFVSSFSSLSGFIQLYYILDYEI